MSDNEINEDSFVSVLYSIILDQVEARLNDPENYPINEKGKSNHREYILNNSVWNEKTVKSIEEKNNKLYGYPTISEGEIICKDTDTGENIGTISIKVEISYNLNKEVTTIDSNT
jgi:hypothetical protein